MPIAKYTSLQKLVISLTKAEKRYFVLYANRLESNKEGLFLKLFHLMAKHPSYSEEQIWKVVLKISRIQFVNVKRHLYSQLLKSLRIMHEQSDTILAARQGLDYASILYKRGQYHESLSILNSIKHETTQLDNILSLEVAEFQKKIESRHITRSRSTKNKIESIVAVSQKKQQLIAIESQMSSSSLEVQGLYIKWGFARDDRDALVYQVYFQSQVPEYELVKRSPIAVTLWHQAKVWYHYMRLDFHFSYRHAVLWVTKMEQAASQVSLDPDLYVRGYHYILTNCFYLNRPDKFQYWFDRYKGFRKSNLASFNETSLLLDFCYFDNAELNARILNKRYSKLETYASELEQKMISLSDRLDVHRILMFYYKLALMHSYKGEYEKAIGYLNKVLDNQEHQLRSDIFSYARLVHLMCHYRINNFALVLNLLPSVKGSFEASGRMNPVVESMISFLRKGSKAMNFGINDLFDMTLIKVEQSRKHSFDKVAFLYYDFSGWLKKK